MEEEKQSAKVKLQTVKKDKFYFKVNKKGKHVCIAENFLRVFVIPVLRLIYPFRVYGAKKVPDGACVLVGNHYGMFDTMYHGVTTWEGLHLFAKSSIQKFPWLKWFGERCGIIYVNRDGNDVRGVMNAIKCLRHGDKVSLFPEGTRNKTDAEILPFMSGASMIAIKAKVPIVPITLYMRTKPFKMQHVIVGEPVEFSEYYDKKLTEDLLKEADEKLKSLILQQRYDHAAYLKEKKKK